jgi:hypothetical protein
MGEEAAGAVHGPSEVVQIVAAETCAGRMASTRSGGQHIDITK